jgi:shikimate dehydrogenase
MAQKLLALIGKSLSHSFSPFYFNSLFEVNNYVDYSYITIEIDTIDEIQKVLLDYPNLIGFNVTFPYKEKIIPYLDKLSPNAKKIGAVNVVKLHKENGIIKLHGFNTDYDGFLAILKRLSYTNVHSYSALVLGTGGASKTVQFVLKKKKIPFYVISRDPTKGDLTYDQITKEIYQTHKLIINCTPLGTFPNVTEKPPIDYSGIGGSHILVDLVYNPQESAFLKEGLHKNCRIINGLMMLTVQADKSWKIFNS